MDRFYKILYAGQMLTQRLALASKHKGNEILSTAKKKSDKVQEFVKIPVKTRLHNSAKFVDDTLGVSQVVAAQENVFIQESIFLKSREQVSQLKLLLDKRQDLLNEVRQKVDRTDRADEQYLSHVAEEHKQLLEVKKLQREYQLAEETEREKFLLYSSSVRLSHEKERSRAERTKYWSVIASICGTVLGVLCSSIVTRYRLARSQEMSSSLVLQLTENLRAELETRSTKLLQKINEVNLGNEVITDFLRDIEVLTQIFKMRNEGIKEHLVLEQINSINLKLDQWNEKFHGDAGLRETIHALKNDIELLFSAEFDKFSRKLNGGDSSKINFRETAELDTRPAMKIFPTILSQDTSHVLDRENINVGLSVVILSVLMFNTVYRWIS